MKHLGKGFTLGVLGLAAACGGGEKAPRAEDTAPAQEATGPDPCGLVSQSEMESLIGPLAEPPYRVDSDRRTDPNGEGCFYRARDYRNVTVVPDFEDGELSFRMLAGTGKSVSDILVGYDAETDTLEGAWDKIGSAFGQVIALKGKTSVQVDPLGSRLGLAGAIKVLSLALRRVENPLSYDGSAAARARPNESALARDPCSLVTRQEVEALMGPLAAAPRPAADGDGCDFPTPLEMFGVKVTRTLTVQWKDGFYALGQERSGMEGAAKAMAAQIDPDLPTIGANTTGEAEPWDERVTLVGGVVTVVRHDALLKIAGDGLGGFNEAKALALLRIAARRIQKD
jgi:hypothetical protein